MAQYERVLTGDLHGLVGHLEHTIPGSVSSTSEGGSDHRIGEARMAVRAYERYSAMGGNRVSLVVSVLAVGDQLSVSAITAGASRAVFWKVNTIGEHSFLDVAVAAIESYQP